MLSDDERARQVVLEVDTTYSYAQIPEALRPILEREIAKAFAAIREECAKAIPTNWLDPLLTGPNKVIQGPKYSNKDIENLCHAIQNRIRTAQPGKANSAKPAEKATVCLCGAPIGSEWCRDRGHR
jgi:hypothetical protein